MRQLAFWSLIICLLAGAGCFRSTGPGDDSETHFLQQCDMCDTTCGEGLTCICGVCTKTCDADSACADLPGEAVCAEADAFASSRQCDPFHLPDNSVCDVTCTVDDDCKALGEGFVCRSGSCRQGADDGGPDQVVAVAHQYIGPCTEEVDQGADGTVDYRNEYFYDEYGPGRVIWHYGNVANHTYDGLGRIVSTNIHLPEGEDVRSIYSWDDQYQLRTKTEILGDDGTTANSVYYTHVGHDNDLVIQDPELERNGPGAEDEHYILTYDENGNLISADYDYDYEYDLDFDLARQSAEGWRDTFTYDDSGRMVTRRQWRAPGIGSQLDCAYDEAGHLTSETATGMRPNGELLVGDSYDGPYIATYAYDDNGNIVSKQTEFWGGPDLGSYWKMATHTYTYDDNTHLFVDECDGCLWPNLLPTRENDPYDGEVEVRTTYDCWNVEGLAWPYGAPDYRGFDPYGSYCLQPTRDLPYPFQRFVTGDSGD